MASVVVFPPAMVEALQGTRGVLYSLQVEVAKAYFAASVVSLEGLPLVRYSL